MYVCKYVCLSQHVCESVSMYVYEYVSAMEMTKSPSHSPMANRN